jgi:hypothetical protein
MFSKEFLQTEVSVRNICPMKIQLQLLLMIAFIVVEWNSRFKEEPLSGKTVG